jgi:hypothetical protein
MRLSDDSVASTLSDLQRRGAFVIALHFHRDHTMTVVARPA